jgi:diguanylate cyclase (GGDEF)-like protein
MNEGPGSSGNTQHPLNREPSVPTLGLMRFRVFVGLALGAVGIFLGVLGALTSNAVLSIVAAVAAVGACALIATVALRAQPAAVPVVSHNVDIDAPVPLSGPTTEESVIDSVTGLPDGRFFEVAVDGRVAAARRHLWPVSIVMLQLGFDTESNTAEARNRSLVSFAGIMRQTLREADIACRLDENTFGLILEDTSEEGGVWTAERLQIALSHDNTNIRRLVAGVAAYPTHGLFSKDVLVRARAALQRASASPNGHGLGQVEVAHVDLS